MIPPTQDKRLQGCAMLLGMPPGIIKVDTQTEENKMRERCKNDEMTVQHGRQQKNLYTFFHRGQRFLSSRSSSISSAMLSSRMPVCKSMLCERTMDVR